MNNIKESIEYINTNLKVLKGLNHYDKLKKLNISVGFGIGLSEKDPYNCVIKFYVRKYSDIISVVKSLKKIKYKLITDNDVQVEFLVTGK